MRYKNKYYYTFNFKIQCFFVFSSYYITKAYKCIVLSVVFIKKIQMDYLKIEQFKYVE